MAQPSRDRGTELQHPSPHCFVGDVEPSFGQQFLDIAVAQGEAEIEPDRVLDDLGREAMAAVAERAHADILSDTPLASDPVSVTMPWSLTSLREKLIKIGAKVVSHGRYVTFQMAEVAVPRQIFADILSLIARLRAPPAPA